MVCGCEVCAADLRHAAHSAADPVRVRYGGEEQLGISTYRGIWRAWCELSLSLRHAHGFTRALKKRAILSAVHKL